MRPTSLLRARPARSNVEHKRGGTARWRMSPSQLLIGIVIAAVLLGFTGCTSPNAGIGSSDQASGSRTATQVSGIGTASRASVATPSSHLATVTPPPPKAPTPATRPTASGAPAKTPAPPVTRAPARAPPKSPRLYPNPALTPGDVLPVTAAQVSVGGYASRVRNVPASEKREVYAEYKLAYPQATGAFECDHFIPLCLGGSNSIKNLWPEPSPEFHWKDGLEVYLWREVRARRITLAAAQREMRTDWYSYWVKAGKPGSAADADSDAVQGTPAPAAKAKATTSAHKSGGLVVGWSVSGKRYHYLSCADYLKILPTNKRTGTIAQAKAAGKTPCKVCKPPE